ncbi:tetratricopeptide repeat protein [Verrucosispora sp. WMMA2121]|uniref:tetratricopeptide repeat protein n=1 Tax=Verrucosispora sp. WMMA2121 TaxID=3015164 RepID=UPI0022B69B36|nr:tetratricopeptide repeat protein [Verrucosispora sp. WMMA2121]MCZ7418281.1 tetratricopeptide repeat protein [Verrucosispora sp. WMMA2121]
MFIEQARLLLALYRPSDAAAVLWQAYELHTDPDVSAWLIASLSRSRNYKDATAVAIEACKRFPESVLVRISTGRVSTDQYQFEEALSRFREANSIDESNLTGLTWLLRGLRDLRRHDEIEALIVANELSSSKHGLEWGKSLLDRYQPERGLAAFNEALSIDPRDADALEWRVTALRDLRRFDEAEEAVRDAIARRPDAPNLRVELGYLHDDRYDFVAALEAFEQALAIDPSDAKALEWRVVALRRLRRFDEAGEAVRDAIARRPDAPNLRVALGYLQFSLHDYGSALEAFEQALAIDPSDADALEWRVTALRDLRRFDEAEEAVRDAIARRPDAPNLRSQLGYLQFSLHEYGSALEAFEQALAIDPSDVDALEWRVVALRRLRRFDEAGEAVRDAIARRPDAPSLRSQLGYLQFSLHEYGSALEAFEQALAIDPSDAKALEWRVVALRDLRRFDEAEEAVRDAIARRPDAPNLRVELGYLHDDRYDFVAALEAFEQALAIDPSDAKALEWRVVALRRLRRFDEAGEAVRDAIARRPDAPNLRVALGYLQFSLHDYGSALEAFEQALAIDPSDVDALEWRVVALRRLRRFDEAGEAVRDAIARRPDAPNLRVALGYLHDDRYDFVAALEAFEQALAIDPSDADALESRVGTLCNMRRFDEAEEVVRDAIVRRPDMPNLRISLGHVYIAQYDYVAALEAFDQALAIDPSDAHALRWRVIALRRLRRFDEAGKVVRDAIVRRPDVPNLRVQLGFVHYDQYEEVAALKAFEQALAIDPDDADALEWRITALRRLRRFEEAEQAVRDAIVRRPDAASLYVELGYLHDDRYEHASALESFERALTIDSRNEWALVGRSNSLRLLRRFEEAEEAARDAATKHPTSSAPLLELANIAEDRGRYEDVLDAVLAALSISPRDEAALAARIRVMRQLRNFSGALEVAHEAVKIRPDSVDVLIELGQVYVDRREYQRALEMFERVLAIDAGRLRAVEYRVAVLRRLQRHADAERCAREAIALRPTNESNYINLGLVFEDRLQPQEALIHYRSAARFNPRNPRVIVGQSAALRSLRSCAEAERLVASMLQMQPNERTLSMELAWIRHDAGRLAESRASFVRLESTAIADEERAASIAGQGWVDFACGDYVAASEHFSQAVALLPHNREYRLAVAWALMRQDEQSQWERAEDICFEVLNEEQDAAVLVCLGIIDYRMGRLPAAEHHLQQALEVDSYKGSHTDLGALYTQLGRYEEADTHLRLAIAQDSFNSSARVELGHLRLVTNEWHEAARQFRSVLRTDPSMQVAALGLATALTALGESREAEDVLREGLRTAAKPWRLHLALARLLFDQADATQNDDVFAEAYAEAIEAIKHAPANEPDPHYVAGVCKIRLGRATHTALSDTYSRRQSLRHLRRCLSLDHGHVDAQRIVQLLEREGRTARTAALGTVTVAAVAMILLSVLWTAFFLSTRVTVVMITTITPILVGLVAIAVLLPSLIRLKLPGLEADLQAGLGQITSGPTGDVAIRPGNFAVSLGPIGHAPNRHYSEYRQR